MIARSEHKIDLLFVDIDLLAVRSELPPPLKLGGCNRWRPEVINAAIDRLGHRVGRKITPSAGLNEAEGPAVDRPPESVSAMQDRGELLPARP